MNNIDVVIALVAVLGVIVGATLQYLYAQRTEITKHYQELRSNAYVDFIKSTAGIAISQKKGDAEKELEFTILMADAKARVAIYGDKAVVDAMAEFFRKYGALQSPDAISVFVSLVHRMRQETVGIKQNVLDKEISQLLFSVD